MQNNFSLGDDSSSDGSSVTISIEPKEPEQQAETEQQEGPEQQPAPEQEQQAEPELLMEPPAARKSKRGKIPRKMFTL